MKYEKNFNNMKAKMAENTERALEAIGEQIAKEASRRAPVDTGRLSKSIEYKVSGNEVQIGTNVEYAKDVELGSSKQKAQPYLENSAMENTGMIESTVKREMSNI